MKENTKRGGILTFLVIGIVIGLVILSNTNLMQTQIKKEWQTIATGADDDPGAGAPGILNIFVYPHSADPATDYATNLSEGSAYAYGHIDSALTGNVPYDTEFDIVVKVRYNTTHAYNSTGSAWVMDWVRANITCADLSIGALTAMSKVQTGSNATYLWVQYYMNNADAGYTISHGETVNVTYFGMAAYF